MLSIEEGDDAAEEDSGSTESESGGEADEVAEAADEEISEGGEARDSPEVHAKNSTAEGLGAEELEEGIGGVELSDLAEARHKKEGGGKVDAFGEGKGGEGESKGEHRDTDDAGFEGAVRDCGDGDEAGEGSDSDGGVADSETSGVETELIGGDRGHLEDVGDAEE